jgi:hypothetical protein
VNNKTWKKYVDCFRETFDNCEFKDELIEVYGGYDDIACAVFFHAQTNFENAVLKLMVSDYSESLIFALYKNQ